MRILSQDGIGMIDLPYEQVGVSIYSKTKIIAYPITSLNPENYWTIAEYSTEVKAKKAMEMLRKSFEGLPTIIQDIGITDEVVDMFKKWKAQGIHVQVGQQSKVEHLNSGYFRFPTDSELDKNQRI